MKLRQSIKHSMQVVGILDKEGLTRRSLPQSQKPVHGTIGSRLYAIHTLTLHAT